MADPEKSSESQNPDLIQQDVEGSQNQIVGHAKDTVIIGRAGKITIQSPQSSNEITSKSLIRRSPYLGLNKFEIRDKHLFFGRDQLIDRLIIRLQSSPLLLVLGASGSGKSSLVRAGLIPKLLENMDAVFREIIFTPDRDPFDSFRSSLRSAGFRQADIELLQTNQPDALRKTVHLLKQADENWFIFIDQFEELFTLCQDLQKRQAFIEGLIQLVQAKIPGAQLVLAMRADFLGRLGAFPRLTGILQRSELITDMSDGELRLAIEKPAAQHGVVCEPELTENIIRDLKGHPTTNNEAERIPLTLLQYTLKLLWESSGDLSDRTLHVHTYRSLGGVRGALQRQVDEIYARLPEEQKQATKHIFLQLIDTVGADAGTTTVGKAVSRRAVLDEFNPAEQQVLYKLVDAGLLVSDDSTSRIGEEGDRPFTSHKATVELAHETLIDAWDTLRAWIEESRPLIRLRHQLREDALRWYQIHCDNPAQAEAELWQGSKLKHLQSQREEMVSRFGDFKPEEVQFVKACEELGDRTRQREVRNLRRTIAGVSVSLVVASGLAVSAGYQWLRAAQGQILAESQTAQAQFALNPNTLDSLLNALRASEDYMQIPKIFRDSELQLTVMEALTQSVYWVKEINRLDGHTKTVREVVFSADGQTFASASEDNTVKLWNRNGSLLAPQINHGAMVISLALSADGRLIASGSEDGSIKLWTNQGQLIASIPKAHSNWVSSITFDPKNRFFASASEDGDIKLWDFHGNPIRELQTEQGAINSITFSPDGEKLATAGDDNLVWLWSPDLQKQGVLSGHQALVYAVAFSPDGSIIATGSKDGTVRLWQSNGDAITTFPANSEGWTSVSFSPDGKWIAASSRAEEGAVQIWDRAGNSVTTLRGHNERVFAVSFSPTELILASAGADRTIKLWNLESPLVTVLNNYIVGDNAVFDVSFSRDSQVIASATRSGLVEVWDLKTHQSWQLVGHESEVWSVSISPQSDRIVSTGLDGTIRLWSLQDRWLLKTIENAHTAGGDGVQFSPQGDRFVSGGEDALAKLWDSQGNLLKTLEGHTGAIYRVSFSPDGSKIATASQDATVRIWDQAGSLERTLIGHQAAVWDAAFSPDGRLIATASDDKTVKLWDSNGRLLHTFTGHEGPVNAIVFDPNGERIFSASDDKTVKAWDIRGNSVATLTGHTGIVSALSISGDGSILASGASDGKVIVRNMQVLNLEQMHQLGCVWLRDFLSHHSDDFKDLCRSIH